MVMNESVENYLETILVLNHRLGNGFITVSPEGYIHLTESGREVAEKIYERHTTLSSWLVMLGVDPRIAAEDACKIEHDVSAESFEAIKRHINSVSK